MKNIYYFFRISRIGGIETFFYQLAKKYKDWDLTIYYRYADPEQLKRLKKYVRCVRYVEGQKIKCDKAFFNFNTDILDNVEAKEYCLVVHGNYEWLETDAPTHPKITKYYGVSKDACKSFTKLTGFKCEPIYNPIELEKPQRLVKLVAACRMEDPVKGGSRTKELVKALDNYCNETGNKYMMTVFTNELYNEDGTKKAGEIVSDNVVYMKPRLDIAPYMVDADYVVQLSDNFEGYNYTVNEALSYGTPVVITPCNVYKELGITDKDAIFLDFDLSNMDEVVKNIFTKKLKPTYTPPTDSWDQILVKGKSTYKEEMNKKYLVRATKQWLIDCLIDNDLGIIPPEGYEYEIDGSRLDVLTGNNQYGNVYVEIVKEIK